MESVITSLAEVTPAWLSERLLRSGTLREGRATRISLEAGETSFCITAHLRVVYDPPEAGPARLFLKFSKPRHPVSTPESGAEVTFYRSIAPATPLPALLSCYEARFDPQVARLHLLLEDVSTTHFSEPASQLPIRESQAPMVVDALASVHAAWWTNPPFELSGGQPPSASELERRIEGVRHQVREFEGYLRDRLSSRRRAIYRDALAALPTLYRRLLDPAGYSVIHDDVHIGNVLYPIDAERDTVRLIDWQTWHVDLAVKDLAHMMAIFWFPERRQRLEMALLERYHRQLSACGVEGYSWDALWADYRLCVIRKLFHPAWQWSTGHHPNIWWNHLERVFTAFEDLNCRELLSSSPGGHRG